jgi:hypothetical protein
VCVPCGVFGVAPLRLASLVGLQARQLVTMRMDSGHDLGVLVESELKSMDGLLARPMDGSWVDAPARGELVTTRADDRPTLNTVFENLAGWSRVLNDSRCLDLAPCAPSVGVSRAELKLHARLRQCIPLAVQVLKQFTVSTWEDAK